MKAIEILGIQHGRDWNVASLNEVRLYFGLKPHATFRKSSLNKSFSQQMRITQGTTGLYVNIIVIKFVAYSDSAPPIRKYDVLDLHIEVQYKDSLPRSRTFQLLSP